MTSPVSRRPATLPFALRLALGGAFVALADVDGSG
ncbi:Trehalase [Klebsiella michiganensis]|nr:Trehalase [Klebsiella michiganensis]